MKSCISWAITPCRLVKTLLGAFSIQVSYLPNYFTLRMEAGYSSETSLTFTTIHGRYIPEDRTPYNYRRENFRSNIKKNVEKRVLSRTVAPKKGEAAEGD
jgi:hypothetical protein